MYINRIVIKNYRNLKDIDLLLDDSINCIVGENNSGKTNFLQAIRLAIDANLSNYYRTLTENDFSDGIDISVPNQIMIALQFTDYNADKNEKKVKEHALMQEWEIDEDSAQVCYRFRPSKSTRQKLIDGELKPGELKIDSYGWEVVVGQVSDEEGNVKDIADVVWDDDFTNHVKFNRMSAYKLTFLHAIRDVEEDLRIQSKSPLQKLIKIADLSDAKKKELIDKIKKVIAVQIRRS